MTYGFAGMRMGLFRRWEFYVLILQLITIVSQIVSRLS